ncbi:MAG: hypothetical protein H0W40_07970 [Methylibium sp.]|uniref:hypothetical protein n=1 Tax=Methylibium sp. TaxID=2067992 RepID=UPI001827FBA2|nr:hypothetical protein [Methylibium sp.]MBA3597299.1 hypothetical protein [Methylibium sp.]
MLTASSIHTGDTLPSLADVDTEAAALLDLWQRLQMRIRCGLAVRATDHLRLYLHIGRRIARRGLASPVAVQLRLLNTLLRTAQDDALPWAWRSACLRHAQEPLALLCGLVGPRDPAAMRSIESAVRHARNGLPAAPPERT